MVGDCFKALFLNLPVGKVFRNPVCSPRVEPINHRMLSKSINCVTMILGVSAVFYVCKIYFNVCQPVVRGSLFIGKSYFALYAIMCILPQLVMSLFYT
jgi:hypothetical protein